jgi:hypothetical protein
MDGLASSSGASGVARVRAVALAAERRTIGRVAGVASVLAAVVGLVTLQLLSPQPVPTSFDFIAAVSMASGIAFILVPWYRIAAWWLHAIPVIAIVETAVGIRLSGAYDDIAANYYVFVGVFAGYAFCSRKAIAAHVALASVASALPLLYAPTHGSESAAPTILLALD